jgi:hypothetical protein
MHITIGETKMTECEICDKQFIDTKDGLTELTMHKIVRHGDTVNQPAETRVGTPESYTIQKEEVY